MNLYCLESGPVRCDGLWVLTLFTWCHIARIPPNCSTCWVTTPVWITPCARSARTPCCCAWSSCSSRPSRTASSTRWVLGLETLAVINLIEAVNQSWQKFIKLFAKFDGKAKLLSHVVKKLLFINSPNLSRWWCAHYFQEYLTKLSNETEDQSQVASLEEELSSLMREEQQLVEELRDLKEENKTIEEELEEQGKARWESVDILPQSK